MSHWRTREFLPLPDGHIGSFFFSGTHAVTHTHHIRKTWKLMMCSSYSLTSQRTQTLLKSGRKWVRRYNVWHAAVDRPPWSPRASKLMDTNVSPCENVSPKEKMESPGIWREEREQQWPGDISEPLLGGRGRMFLKMPVFFRCLVPGLWKPPLWRQLPHHLLLRLCFSAHARKSNIKISASVSTCPFSLPLHFKATVEWWGWGASLSISASEDTSETWAWVHCSVEQGISRCKWRPKKSILQTELLTRRRPRESPGPRERGRDGDEWREEMEVKGEKGFRRCEDGWLESLYSDVKHHLGSYIC